MCPVSLVDDQVDNDGDARREPPLPADLRRLRVALTDTQIASLCGVGLETVLQWKRQLES